MQTFLPWDDFDDSAACLDRQRLGKQRVETMQILNVLEAIQPDRFASRIQLIGPQHGWTRHPAVLMWKGYEMALCDYGLAICYEWLSRGYKDGVKARFIEFQDKYHPGTPYTDPPWLGREELHSSHRAALVHKLPEYYADQFPDATAKLDYWWPTQHGY
jgi:hypothetical protein